MKKLYKKQKLGLPGRPRHEQVVVDQVGSIKDYLYTVLRIPDVYPGSDFFPSRIRIVSIPDPHQRI
jgi:hypothetical protein